MLPGGLVDLEVVGSVGWFWIEGERRRSVRMVTNVGGAVVVS